MAGLAKSRLVEYGTARVVSGRRRARSAAAELVDAADAAQRGFVSELERTPERIFLPGRKDPLVLRQNSAELFLLARLRDEAHRFAITFHRKLRRSRNFQSVLEEIPGIGAGRRKALLRTLGSLKRVKEASLEEIARVEGFGPKAAQAVWDFFHPAEGAPVPDGVAKGLEEAAAPEVTEADIDTAIAEEQVGPEASEEGGAPRSGYPSPLAGREGGVT